ncbi:MICOS complex subunit MIC13-like [Dromiciops gliroides]|uniref:MICOS complex subunit MIC13-like n=1 Tax=Dromiciops gliroides TaxID=33562 RepID=UPI001CC5BEE2|nr:MICOS complex subunit MIC13-like [Dromiciops gliroides]
MATHLWPLLGFCIKASLAGRSVYFVYDQGLLELSCQGQAILRRAQETIPVAFSHYSDLLSKHMGIRLELPSTPQFNVNLQESWNSGINSLMFSLSTAPSTTQAYSHEGWNYLKGQK